MQIYEEWQASWMAKAYTNQLFRQEFARWNAYAKQHPRLNPSSCLRCHAPLALLTGDMEVRSSLIAEGVTCDVCHRVSHVEEKGAYSFALVFSQGPIKYGPSKERRSNPFHASVFGEALTTSRVCAACHLDSDDAGTPLEWTYQEWRESSYARQGIQCHDCHMRAAGDGSSSSSTKTQGRSSHRFEGGHSTSSLLKGAATVAILPHTQRHQIKVQVSNTRVGHNFPTKGAHPNTLTLILSGKNDSGEEIYTAQRTYALVNMNAQGQPATGTEPVSRVKDTTLKPHESRTEMFESPVLGHVRTIEAELVYSLIPDWLGKQLDANIFDTDYRPVPVDRAVKVF